MITIVSVVAALRKPEPEGSRSNPGPLAFAAAVIAVAVVAWLPVPVGSATRALFGWVAAVILAVAIEFATRRLSPAVLVAGLAAASSLVSSGLVTDQTRYMPVIVMGGALALRASLGMWRRRRLYSPPPMPIVVTVGLYLLWAAVTALTSIDHRTSATYIAGMVGFFWLAFWAIPNMLDTRRDRGLVLAALGGLGAAIALTIYVGSVIGPKVVFGRIVGDYLVSDLTLRGHPTGLEFGRSAGVYLAPFEPAILMVIGIIALVALASFQRDRRRLAALAGLAFIIPAEALTLDRSAWLAAATGTATYAVVSAIGRLRFNVAAGAAALFVVLLAVVLTNLVGVNAVKEFCAIQLSPGQVCPDWARQSTEASLRGGAALTGRQYLWDASLKAVEARPIVGFGPGNNVPAIQPYLSTTGQIYKGLTSHSTWLRTAVEMGVPGLLLLLGILLTAGSLFLSRLLSGRGGTRDPVQLSFAATIAGLVAAMIFESFLLGGITFPNLYPALAIGLLMIPAATRQLAGVGARPLSQSRESRPAAEDRLKVGPPR